MLHRSWPLLTLLGSLLLGAALFTTTLTATGPWDSDQLWNYLISLRPALALAGGVCLAGALLLSAGAGGTRPSRGRLRLAVAIALAGAMPLGQQLLGPGLVRSTYALRLRFSRWNQQRSAPVVQRQPVQQQPVFRQPPVAEPLVPADSPTPSSLTPCARSCPKHELCDQRGGRLPELPVSPSPREWETLRLAPRDGLCHQLCGPRNPCDQGERCQLRDLGTDTTVALVWLCFEDNGTVARWTDPP